MLNGRKVKFFNTKNATMQGTISHVFFNVYMGVLYFLLILEDNSFVEKRAESCTLLPLDTPINEEMLDAILRK